jgi:hypothetical protein
MMKATVGTPLRMRSPRAAPRLKTAAKTSTPSDPCQGYTPCSIEQYVPALRDVVTSERLEHALQIVENQFQQLRQQYVDVESTCLSLETQQCLLEEKTDELTSLKNLENKYDDEVLLVENSQAELLKLRKQTQELAVKTYDTMHTIEETTNKLQKFTEENSQNPEEALRGQMNKWYKHVNGAISYLSGVHIIKFGDGEVHLGILPRTAVSGTLAHYSLHIKLKPDTTKILSIQLSPADVPIDDLFQLCGGGGGAEGDLFGLKVYLCEVRARIHNWMKRRTELAALSNKYALTTANNDSQITITFKSGYTCKMVLDGDYPRPHSIVYVASIEGPSRTATHEADRLRNEWNNMNRDSVSLSDLVAYMELRLNAIPRA